MCGIAWAVPAWSLRTGAGGAGAARRRWSSSRANGPSPCVSIVPMGRGGAWRRVFLARACCCPGKRAPSQVLLSASPLTHGQGWLLETRLLNISLHSDPHSGGGLSRASEEITGVLSQCRSAAEMAACIQAGRSGPVGLGAAPLHRYWLCALLGRLSAGQSQCSCSLLQCQLSAGAARWEACPAPVCPELGLQSLASPSPELSHR